MVQLRGASSWRRGDLTLSVAHEVLDLALRPDPEFARATVLRQCGPCLFRNQGATAPRRVHVDHPVNLRTRD